MSSTKHDPATSLNERQRRFCEFVVAGFSDVEAYRKAGYRAKEPHKRACEIRAFPGVARFIAKLRQPRENAAVLTLEMKRAFLCDVVRTPVGSIAPSDALAQEFRSTKEGMLVKMPDKLRAIELDAKLAGELAGDKAAEKQADALLSLMQSIATNGR